jgi:hypothetical protein
MASCVYSGMAARVVVSQARRAMRAARISKAGGGDRVVVTVTVERRRLWRGERAACVDMSRLRGTR